MSTDKPYPRGEVCFWGPSLTPGYFKNPEKTAELYDGEWLKSGDVGQIYPNGAIKIIDRAKNIFKLSQGEYIAPEKLENVYILSSWVMQVMIYGNSLRDFVVAIIVVDPDKIAAYANTHGLMKDGKVDPAALNDVRPFINDDFKKLADENKFNSLERPK